MSSTITSDLIINNGTSTTVPTKSLELQNSISSIVLGNNINTTPVFTTISPTAITQGANSISLQNLTLLPQVLASVELPPNATTLKINDTLLVDAGIANQTTTIEDGKITINNASVGGIANPLLVLQNNNTTAGGSTIETYKNDLPTSTGGDVVGIWTASCNTNVGKTEIARISQIAYGVGASNNDGGIILACKVNSSLAPTNFLACNGGAGAGEVQIFRPITNPNGDIALNATSSSGTGDILLTPKTTGYVRVSEDILTDSKITTLTGYPINTGSSIDFIASPDYRFTIDPTKLELHYNNLINSQTTQQIFQDILTDEAYFKQTYIDYVNATTTTTTLQNDNTHHRIRLEDITNNKSITIDNDFTINDNRLSFYVDDSSSIYSSTIINNDTIQQLSFSKITGTSGKFLQFNNLSQGEIFFINNLDTNPLVIESNQDLNINSTKAGGFINLTSTSSIDITATGDNLVLRGGAVAQLEATGTGADVILKPETTAGDLVLEGANLEFASAGGNSGQHLRIKLNGTYYKIKLESD
jgi:hypothetical protein